jgi:hypothetical protein
VNLHRLDSIGKELAEIVKDHHTLDSVTFNAVVVGAVGERMMAFGVISKDGRAHRFELSHTVIERLLAMPLWATVVALEAEIDSRVRLLLNEGKEEHRGYDSIE